MKDMVDEVHLGGSMPTLPTTVAISLAAALAVHMISSLIRQRQKMGGKGPHKDKRSAQHSIPIAPGPIPILGHALKYKDDPPGFLEYACRHVTSTMKLEETNESSSNGDEKNSDVPPPIFKINLAGKEMIIVARDCPALRQIANSPESKCSARQAVADVGFEQTLGYNNVHVGTDVHKRIIKSVLFEGKSQWEPMEVPLVFESVQHAFREELRRLQVKQPKCNTNIGTIKVPDLFHFVRRILLRVTMERFVGREAVLEPNLLEEFMTFQDALEDATAQAAVLPRPIALVAFLWPVQRKRLALQRRIANVLRKYYCKADSDTETPTSTNADNTDGTTRIGFWLQEILNEGKHSIEDISEYIVGLLFAAHKNPAIGAAQAYLFLFERGTSQDQTSCKEEAYNVCQLATLKTSSKSITASKLKESCPRLHQVCLETLRLTGHTIGGLRTARDDIPLSTGSFDVRQGRSRDNFQDSKVQSIRASVRYCLMLLQYCGDPEIIAPYSKAKLLD